MQDLSGNLVESTSRAETFAEYYEKVQWVDVSAGQGPQPIPSQQPRDPTLPVSAESFTLKELRALLKKLGQGRACGPDWIPAELWIAFADDDGALQHLLLLCSKAWNCKCIPESWSSATVVALFKSGSTALPQNYRHISLLSVGYNFMARLILNHLRSSGVKDNLRSSQFGFRDGRSTSHAIFLAKRLIDRAVAAKEGKL